MSTEGLIKFFMARRHCDLKRATWLADQVVIKRRLASERQTAHLETAQLTLGMDEMPAEEPTHRSEPDDPTVNF